MRLLEWIDVRGGIYAGLAMGSAVALINASHGLAPASVAGAKQAVYTFFFGGAVMRLCAHIAAARGGDGALCCLTEREGQERRQRNLIGRVCRFRPFAESAVLFDLCCYDIPIWAQIVSAAISTLVRF